MNLKKLSHKKPEKSLINLNILQKHKIKKRHLAFSLVVLIIFLLNKRYFVFGALSIISGIFSFYHDKYNRTPIDFKLALFLGIIITRYYGILFTFIFFIFSDFIPSMLGGGSIEGADLLFIGWYFVVNLLVLPFKQANIIYLGIILVIVETIGSTIIKSMTGFPGIVAFTSSVLSVAVRIIYFLTLGEVLIFMIERLLNV